MQFQDLSRTVICKDSGSGTYGEIGKRRRRNSCIHHFVPICTTRKFQLKLEKFLRNTLSPLRLIKIIDDNGHHPLMAVIVKNDLSRNGSEYKLSNCILFHPLLINFLSGIISIYPHVALFHS